MTRDVAYIVRVEDEKQGCLWLSRDSSNEACVCFYEENATPCYSEEEVKQLLRDYYSNRGSIGEKDRVFICKVSVTDCACFTKTDMDLLLSKEKA